MLKDRSEEAKQPAQDHSEAAGSQSTAAFLMCLCVCAHVHTDVCGGQERVTAATGHSEGSDVGVGSQTLVLWKNSQGS